MQPTKLILCPQVLGEVFNCLHRAQLGSAATGGLDPQLPQLVRVPTASSSGSLSALATPSDPTPRHHCASSMAQDVFGQKVQVGCLVYNTHSLHQAAGLTFVSLDALSQTMRVSADTGVSAETVDQHHPWCDSKTAPLVATVSILHC